MGCAGLLTCHVLSLLLPAGWNKDASNLVFVAASVFAIVCLPAAQRRAEGVARTYWLLFAVALAVFGIANLICWAKQLFDFRARSSMPCCFSIGSTLRPWR